MLRNGRYLQTGYTCRGNEREFLRDSPQERIHSSFWWGPASSRRSRSLSGLGTPSSGQTSDPHTAHSSTEPSTPEIESPEYPELGSVDL
jgi:hypothetical protein